MSLSCRPQYHFREYALYSSDRVDILWSLSQMQASVGVHCIMHIDREPEPASAYGTGAMIGDCQPRKTTSMFLIPMQLASRASDLGVQCNLL
jgi:hypothetical protein